MDPGLRQLVGKNVIVRESVDGKVTESRGVLQAEEGKLIFIKVFHPPVGPHGERLTKLTAFNTTADTFMSVGVPQF